MIDIDKLTKAIECLKEAASIINTEQPFTDIELLAIFNYGVKALGQPVLPTNKVKQYPVGAIKSYEELCDVAYHDVWRASRKFHSVYSLYTLSLKFAEMRDSNITENGYNDWFFFAKEEDARNWACK